MPVPDAVLNAHLTPVACQTTIVETKSSCSEGRFAMRGVSIRTLMAFVLLSAIICAVLRNANEFWAGAMLLVALDMVGIAIFGAIFWRGLK